MPPSSGDARLARPWPNSSRSGSWRVDTLIASATVAESRLSSAARAATATAGATSTRSSLHVTDGTVSVNSCEGRAPMVATGRWATLVTTVAPTTAISATGTAGRHREPSRISTATPALRARAARSGAENQSTTAATAATTTWPVAPVTPRAERHLLQGDQGGDAEREPLDDGQRDEAHVAAGPGQRHRDEEQPGHQPDHDHAARPVLGDDRHQHHGHRAGRAGHLHVAAAEHRGHDPGHDGRHEAGRGTEPRRDAEGQGQGQRDDPHRDAGHQVGAGGVQHRPQVTAARAHGIQPGAQQPKHVGAGGGRAHRLAAVGVRSGVMSSTSPPWSAAFVSRMARALASRSFTAGRARE